MVLASILLATFLVSLISFIGLMVIGLKDKILNRLTLIFVALSAGALIGGAFLHLIPESLELNSLNYTLAYVLIGFSLFFVVENILHWRHCHDKECEIHPFAYMNLIGESIHNFIDGLIIAAAFLTSAPLGITTTLAVAFHEIPQEIGDFGILIHGGFKRSKALFLNFLVALTAILGGIVGYYLSTLAHLSVSFLLPIAAGGFIYVAASDLIPEIREHKSLLALIINFLIFILGIAIMHFL